MKKTICAVIGVAAIGSSSAQELTKVPVHDKPVWQVVSGIPDAPGAPVVVRSLATNQPLGAFPIDTKFLSFGSNGQIVTTAINGELVYIPSTAVSRLHPVPTQQIAPPPGPDTLEDLAEAYEERVTGQAQVSLNASNSLVDKASAKGMVGEGANPGMPGSNFGAGGIDPYGTQPMPGAALAQGGLPAIEGMVNPGGGAPDVPGRK